jgi:sulfur-oxidizing protein SoxY
VAAERVRRRAWLAGAAALPWLVPGGWPAGACAQAPRAGRAAAADPFEGDPFQSHPWPDIRRTHLGRGRVVFDDRVVVQGPAFAEDPMNVPISVAVKGLANVQRIVVVVDRNPIRKVLELMPGGGALPAVGFRFKLEQASPVRAAVFVADGGKEGTWHVGGTWVDSAGGGCTVPGATRKDGTWASTLGQVSGRLYGATSPPAGGASGSEAGASRLRLKVMHPMDTGLAGGIPAFYLNRLSVQDGEGRELLAMRAFEPVSENPVFSFDFASPPKGGVQIVGSDNNGNRFAAKVQ